MIIYVAKIDNVPVGTLELFNIDMDNHKAEFGLSFPGRCGVAGIATKMFLSKTFKEWRFNRIYVRPLAINEHAISNAKRLGFKQEGLERQVVFRSGEYLDVVIMSLLKEEYLERWDKNG
jgi:RimJ/RimL family protein N-acetyltransferase